MHSRKRPASKSTLTPPETELIPLEIRQLIEGTSVRIPEPKRFIPQEWRAKLPLVRDQVKETGGAFELHPALFDSFMDSLQVSLKKKKHLPAQYRDYRPSDFIAEALSSAADDFSSGANDGAISLFGQFHEFVEYISKTNDAASSASVTPQYPKIKLALEAKRDGSDPPMLTICVAGEPVKSLIDFNRMPADSPEKTEARTEAKKIWDFVSKRVAVRLGTERPHRGKPESEIGFDVAWMHDHAGLSWAKIAKLVCKMPHQHTESCERNCRKLAKQYYARQTKKYLAEAHRQRVNRPA